VNVRFKEVAHDGPVALLEAFLAPQSEPVSVSYATRSGALLRVDGETAGAFDREHHEVVLAPCEHPRRLELEVEKAALPTNGLPSGPGIVWWYLNARSHSEASREAHVRVRPSIPQDYGANAPSPQHDKRLACIGHSHLDVAWLWTYEQTRRKAQRTFAIACDLLDRDPSFEYVQSQPQLYLFVEEEDAQLFDRVRAFAAQGRFDPRVAALWVESDCNIPSGESLLRQMLFAQRYCRERFGMTPDVAWLPDSFGFANTLPQLLAHAGIPYFMTTKLQWNDTTKFAHPQFVWEGPDGSRIVSAMLQGYDGPAYPWRVAAARKRGEPLLLGFGDGGGGVTPKMLDYVASSARWIRLGEWLEELHGRRDTLPVHRDELYLEYHRGVYTTHHGMKFHNALCERALGEAEELLSWCAAVHAPRASVAQLHERVREAWRIVLRNQFHDVLPGTSIEAVYADAWLEYADAEELAASAIASAKSMLPRSRAIAGGEKLCEPHEDAGAFVFSNGHIEARVRPDGSIVDLAGHGRRNVCTVANVLALYRDTPRQWEAWNIDSGYERHMQAAKPAGARIEDGGMTVDLLLGKSPATMRLELRQDEPFLRVTLAVDWRERRRLLRVENWLAVQTQEVTYGSPHGTIVRSAYQRTPAERAKFEVPGQRFAFARDERGEGAAIFALDTYGWSARALPKGGIKIGHSLLRGTCWPDPNADRGEHVLSYAFAPLAGAQTGEIERAWIDFAHEPGVPLFTADDAAVLVVACKPAEDGEGVIVRVRECNGSAVRARVRCAARMTAALGVDALERLNGEAAGIEQEYLVFDLPAFALRSFSVKFSHEA
jgi:alpha-mannosidase